MTFLRQVATRVQTNIPRILARRWLGAAVAGVLLLLLAAPIAAHPANEASAVEIPFTSDNGVPMVKVMVNGKGPYTFIVDTGEEHLAVINPKIAKDLGLPQVGMGETSDPTNNQKLQAPMFLAAGLEFGGFKAEKVEMFGLDVGLDGVVGLPIFREYLCEFQPASNRIVLRRASLPASNGQDIFSYTTPIGIPDMEMIIAGKALRVHVDAGNPIQMSFPKSMTAGFEWASAPEKIGEAGTIANRFSIFEGRLKTDLHLGRYVFRQPYVVVSDINGTHANFGFGFFKLFQSVSFDQKNRRVRFERDGAAIQIGPG
ncbi:MAG: retroviral-like aspartic protease family protein [Acidobacteriia bacterium]|nr:retroviral-like aspartic protease family protein [Terriglobia bacterium]